jgi:S1-C subfamily serine protease
MVARVLGGAPADKAGLRPANRVVNVGNRQIPVGGDIIVAYDGKTAESTDKFMNYIETKLPGDVVHLNIVRDGKPLTLNVTLAERPH